MSIELQQNEWTKDITLDDAVPNITTRSIQLKYGSRYNIVLENPNYGGFPKGDWLMTFRNKRPQHKKETVKVCEKHLYGLDAMLPVFILNEHNPDNRVHYIYDRTHLVVAFKTKSTSQNKLRIPIQFRCMSRCPDYVGKYASWIMDLYYSEEFFNCPIIPNFDTIQVKYPIHGNECPVGKEVQNRDFPSPRMEPIPGMTIAKKNSTKKRDAKAKALLSTIIEQLDEAVNEPSSPLPPELRPQTETGLETTREDSSASTSTSTSLDQSLEFDASGENEGRILPLNEENMNLIYKLRDLSREEKNKLATKIFSDPIFQAKEDLLREMRSRLFDLELEMMYNQKNSISIMLIKAFEKGREFPNDESQSRKERTQEVIKNLLALLQK